MGDAFVQALMQREAMRRQAMLDEEDRIKQEAAIQVERDRIALARQQEERMGLAEERMSRIEEGNWAKDRTEMAGANERVSPEEVARLGAAGYGGRVDERLASRTAAVPIMPFDAKSPTTAPTSSEGGVFLRPGFRYEQMREAERAREALAQQNAQAQAERAKEQALSAAERAREANASREAIAAQGNQTRLLIAGMGQAQKENAAAEKKAEKDALKEANTQASIDMRDKVIYRVDQLLAKGADGNLALDATGRPALAPGVGALYGSTLGDRATRLFSHLDENAGNARDALDGLISLLDMDTIRAMKEQSRTGATGFGALSEKELNVLENAATTLRGQRMSDAEALRELIKIRNEMITARARAMQEQVKQTGQPGSTTPGQPSARRGRVLSVRPAGQ